MLKRVALVLLLVLMSGVAAIFAAGHFGISLPWEMAETDPAGPTPASKQGDATEQAAVPESATPAEVPDAVADAVEALAPPKSDAAAEDDVALDIARISPDGTSVFAGRAKPDSYVTVLENGKPAGTVKADQNGEWSLSTEHKFASVDPSLTFEASETAPPPPVPPEPPPVVAAAPAAPAQASSTEATSEVMRKFEKLVADAREDAKKQREEAKKQRETASEQAVAPAAGSPDAQERSEASASSGEAPSEERTAAVAQPEVTSPAASPSSSETPPSSDTPSASEMPSSSDTPPASDTAATAPDQGSPPQAASEDEAPTEVAEAAPPTAPASEAPSVIPVPIMFVYNEARLTPEGKRAADLLVEYLALKELHSIELTGHADERGTHEYNMDLSRERLEAVSELLRQGGYSGSLKLTPKGKTEPYDGVDRSAYRGEALYQLDRRVELIVGR